MSVFYVRKLQKLNDNTSWFLNTIDYEKVITFWPSTWRRSSGNDDDQSDDDDDDVIVEETTDVISAKDVANLIGQHHLVQAIRLCTHWWESDYIDSV